MKTNMQHYQALVTKWNTLRVECIRLDNKLATHELKLTKLYELENGFGGFDASSMNAIAHQSSVVSKIYDVLIKTQKETLNSKMEWVKFKSSVKPDKWKETYKE